MPERFPEDDQLPLGPVFHYAAQARRLRALLSRAISANGVSHAELEHETGVDERQIARCLRDDGGAHPPLALVAAVLAKDRAGVFVTGLAAMVGYEARPRTPDLAEENRRLREQLARIRAATEEP